MPFCSFSGSSAMFGVTPVENMFILEYMPLASGDFVRVYLYGLMLCHHPEMDESIGGIARALRVETDTVLNAFRFWEREGLVMRLTDNPPTFEYIPMSRMSSQSEPLDDVYKYKSFNRELQNLLPGMILESHEIRISNEWLDDLGLPEEVALLMVKTEIGKRAGKKLPAPKTLFKHLDEAAKLWAREGVSTVDAAEDFIRKTGAAADCAKQILARFGQSRQPTRDECDLADKWLSEWRLSQEDILESCQETVKSTSPSFAYLDKILLSRTSGDENEAHRENVKKLLSHLGVAARPTQAHLSAYAHFLEMGFDFPAIEQAAILCGSNNKRTFEDIQRRLEVWEKMHVFTLQEIEEERRVQKQYTDITLSIFERCGIERKVTKSDISMVRVWTALIELDAVLFAAECAAGTDAPMKYINKLIVSWSAKGVKTPQAARDEFEKHRTQAAGAGKAEASAAYQQRTVTEEEFETGFYVDVMNRKRESQ